MPCILCGPGLPPESTGESLRFYRYDLYVRVVSFQSGTDTADRASGSYAGYKQIDFTIRITPDLFGGRTDMYGRVSGILELL